MSKRVSLVKSAQASRSQHLVREHDLIAADLEEVLSEHGVVDRDSAGELAEKLHVNL